MLHLEDLSTQLTLFVSGDRSIDDLQRWLTPVLLDDGENVDPTVRDLFFKILYVVEDDSISVQDRRRLLERVVEILGMASGVQVLEEWFEVVMRRDQLREMLGLFLDGVISRTSYLSAIAEADLPERARELFTARDEGDQRWLMDVLTTENYPALLIGPSG